MLEDSAIRYVAVDEGLEKLDSTSAAALIRYLDRTLTINTKTKAKPLNPAP